MSDLHHLIYQSTAIRSFSGPELSRLLHQSRTHNQADDITGILLYDGSRFLQVLEGPPAAVEATYTRIRHDCRHTGLQVLADGPTSRRQFGQWHMGLVAVIDCPRLVLEEPQPALLTINDAALCMLLHDFQRQASYSRTGFPAVMPRA